MNMKRNNNIKLYNMVLPIWLLWLIPGTWIIILPLTFITDSAVLLLSLKALKQNEIKQKYKRTIWEIWVLGFAADIPGIVLLGISQFFPYSQTGFLNWWYENITNNVVFHPSGNIFSLLYVLAAIAVSSVFIYLFNLKISLKNINMDDRAKKLTALSLAVFTSPWLFLLPIQ